MKRQNQIAFFALLATTFFLAPSTLHAGEPFHPFWDPTSYAGYLYDAYAGITAYFGF